MTFPSLRRAADVAHAPSGGRVHPPAAPPSRRPRRLLPPCAVVAAAGLSLVAWLAPARPLAAQQAPATVSGLVRNDAGAPLPFVTVAIPALGVGAETNAQGRYQFTVPGARVQGQTVAIDARLVGYKPGQAQVRLVSGPITQNFTLAVNPLRLTDVVVTGSGTTSTREKLGVSVSSVKSADIVKSAEVNIANALAQKAPGVEVTSSAGDPGAGTGIVIRGFKTISGTGQPLFVVDGMPIDNSVTVSDAVLPQQSFSYANRALDLNPSDIESVEILKGAAAAALYGLRAAEGVILITTKSGRPGATRYTLSSSSTADEVNREIPLQRRWGRGVGGALVTNCPADANCQFRSWGGALPSGTPTYDHWNSVFRTGSTFDNTLQIAGGDVQRTFLLSTGWLNQAGVSRGPNSELDRRTLRLRATQQLTDRFRIGGNVNYTDLAQRAIQKGNNLNGLLLGATRQPPEWNPFPFRTAQGFQRCWTMPDPTQPESQCIFDGPGWVQNMARNTSDVGRTIGNIEANWEPTAWAKLSYTLGADFVSERRLEGLPPFSSGDAFTGQLWQGSFNNRQIDHNLLATLSRQLTSKLQTSLTVGQNLNLRQVRINQVKGLGFVDPALFNLNNMISTNLTPQAFQSDVNIAGYFSELKLDWSDWLYLSGRFRADQSSAFSEANRTGYFPGVSLAMNVTNLLGNRTQTGLLSYLKVRGTYGQVGRSPDPYEILTVYSAGQGVFAYGTGANNAGLAGRGGLYAQLQRGNPDLRYENTAETEAGFDFGLLDGRIDGSATYYSQTTRDLIFAAPTPGSTGFTSVIQNAGRVKNAGVELQLNARLLQRRNVDWEMGVNFTRNRNRLVELRGADFLLLNGGFGNSAAVAGQPLGTFFFTDFARCRYDIDDQENLQSTSAGDGVNINAACRQANAPDRALFIDANGFPVLDPTNRVAGDPTPDWLGGLRSSVRLFRRLQASVLVDVRRGGDVWNGTRGALQSYGTSRYTEDRAVCTGTGAAARCRGNEQTFGRGGWFDGPVVGPGAGRAVPIGENWWRTASAAGPGLGNNFNGPQAQFVEDGGFTRLRELSLAYTLDGRWLRNRAGLSSVDVRLAGRNLFLWTDYQGIDPETNLQGPIGAGRGQDYFNNPQTRSWVLNLTLNR